MPVNRNEALLYWRASQASRLSSSDADGNSETARLDVGELAGFALHTSNPIIRRGALASLHAATRAPNRAARKAAASALRNVAP